MVLNVSCVSECLQKCLPKLLEEKFNSYSAYSYSGIWSIEHNLNLTMSCKSFKLQIENISRRLADKLQFRSKKLMLTEALLLLEICGKLYCKEVYQLMAYGPPV